MGGGQYKRRASRKRRTESNIVLISIIYSSICGYSMEFFIVFILYIMFVTILATQLFLVLDRADIIYTSIAGPGETCSYNH